MRMKNMKFMRQHKVLLLPITRSCLLNWPPGDTQQLGLVQRATVPQDMTCFDLVCDFFVLLK